MKGIKNGEPQSVTRADAYTLDILKTNTKLISHTAERL